MSVLVSYLAGSEGTQASPPGTPPDMPAVLFCERPEELGALLALGRGVALANPNDISELRGNLVEHPFPHFMVGKDAHALAIKCGAELTDGDRFLMALHKWRNLGIEILSAMVGTKVSGTAAGPWLPFSCWDNPVMPAADEVALWAFPQPGAWIFALGFVHQAGPRGHFFVETRTGGKLRITASTRWARIGVGSLPPPPASSVPAQGPASFSRMNPTKNGGRAQ